MADLIVLRANTDADYDHIFDIRTRVFEEELGLEEQAWDGFDHLSQQYLALYKAEAAGTGRWRLTLNGQIRIEQMAVLPAFRGLGIGSALVEAMLPDLPAGREVFLLALERVAPFYARLGFRPEGPPFEAEGQLHQRMVLDRG